MQRIETLPSPHLHNDWREWGHALIQRLIEANAGPDENESDLLLAATGVGGLLAATYGFISWGSKLKSSRLYQHSATSSSDTIIFDQRGTYSITADLNFTASASQTVDARVFISGVDYGPLTRAMGEGTNYINCPILGAFVQVSKGDTLKIGVQGSATTVLQSVSRLWVRKV